jgi:NTE family protein
VRFFLRGVGAMRRSGSSLASYVLFERPFCRALMRLGYDDAMRRRAELRAFFGLEPAPAAPRPLEDARETELKAIA